MHHRLVLAMLLPCAAVLCAACGAFDLPNPKAHTVSTAAMCDASGFGLSVLPDTFNAAGLAGGSAEFSLSTVPAANGMEVVLRASSASRLRGILCGVRYDAQAWKPAASERGTALEALGQTLSLTYLDEPGTVWHGEVLVHPVQQAGLYGDAELLRVRFVPASAADAPARHVSLAPVSDLSRTELTLDGTVLRWLYRSQGDYDQNSETNISDLTPLAVRLGASTGGTGHFQPTTLESVVDGDDNGEVNIADLTPIGINFGRRVTSYNIYESLDPETDYPASNGAPSTLTPIGSLSHSSSTDDPKLGRIGFSFDLGTITDGAAYWVRPADGASEGTPSTQAIVGNIAPVINLLTANPFVVDALGTSALSADATDADGDALTYNWQVTAGSVTGSGAAVTYNAPNVVLDTVVTVSLEVSDGNGGSDTDEIDLTVKAPPPNTPPVINSMQCDPAPMITGGTGTLSADVTDADGDALAFDWEVSLGNVTDNPDNTGTWDAPSVLADTLVTIDLTVDDGNGGVVSDSFEVLVQFVPEDLDHIELDDLDVLPGSGTQADPYLIDGDPGTELQVRFKAIGTLGNDLTQFCAWGETSSAPGTGFSIADLGLLFVSPFDGEFSVNAVYTTTVSNDIYFKVVPPS